MKKILLIQIALLFLTAQSAYAIPFCGSEPASGGTPSGLNLQLKQRLYPGCSAVNDFCNPNLPGFSALTTPSDFLSDPVTGNLKIDVLRNGGGIIMPSPTGTTFATTAVTPPRAICSSNVYTVFSQDCSYVVNLLVTVTGGFRNGAPDYPIGHNLGYAYVMFMNRTDIRKADSDRFDAYLDPAQALFTYPYPFSPSGMITNFEAWDKELDIPASLLPGLGNPSISVEQWDSSLTVMSPVPLVQSPSNPNVFTGNIKFYIPVDDATTPPAPFGTPSTNGYALDWSFNMFVYAPNNLNPATTCAMYKEDPITVNVWH